MSQPEKRRAGSRFQFRLRSLFVLVTVLLIPLGYFSYQARQQQRAIRQIVTAGGFVRYAEPRGIARRLLGDAVVGRVVRVSLHEESIDPSVVNALWDLPEVESLDLSGTPITDEALRTVAELRGLKWLDLRVTRITDVGLQHLRDLPQLEDLEISQTAITDKGLAHLAGLKSLRSLHVTETKVTLAGIQSLQGLQHLESLSLPWTIPESGGSELLTMFPKLINVSWYACGQDIHEITLPVLEQLPGEPNSQP